MEEKTSQKVFIVHGHDEGAKVAVARFVERLALDPVILDEQPNTSGCLPAPHRRKTGGKIMNAKNQGKIFISYGQDKEAKTTVAKFVESLGLKPVILDQQPSKGQTIIDRFEEQADEAGFAIVLLTPDDVGSSKATGKRKLRARQNVIFELGYLLGGLGNQRVCALYKEGVELPSDIHGVVYVPMDDEGKWQKRVIREMMDSDILIQKNKV